MSKNNTFGKKLLYAFLFIILSPIILIEFFVKLILFTVRKRRFDNTIYDKKIFLEQAEIEKIDIMEGFEFERFIKYMFFYLGYEVEITPKGKDFGADLILLKDNIKTAVQIKRYSGKVGIKAVQEIIAAKKHYKAQELMVLTNSHFSTEAETIAKEYSVQLIDRSELCELISKAKTSIEKHNNSNLDIPNSTEMYKFRI